MPIVDNIKYRASDIERKAYRKIAEWTPSSELALSARRMALDKISRRRTPVRGRDRARYQRSRQVQPPREAPIARINRWAGRQPPEEGGTPRYVGRTYVRPEEPDVATKPLSLKSYTSFEKIGER